MGSKTAQKRREKERKEKERKERQTEEDGVAEVHEGGDRVPKHVKESWFHKFVSRVNWPAVFTLLVCLPFLWSAIPPRQYPPCRSTFNELGYWDRMKWGVKNPDYASLDKMPPDEAFEVCRSGVIWKQWSRTFETNEQFELVDKDMMKSLDISFQKLRSILSKQPKSCVATLAALEAEFRVNFTYSSNSIEGNTFTLKDTEQYLLFGKAPPQRTNHERLEIQDHDNAWTYVKSKLALKSPAEYYSTDILHLHWHATFHTVENPGKLRTVPVRISNSPAVTPKHEEIPVIMDDFLAWIRKTNVNVHPVLLAAAAHSKLAEIHPFVDGNGRTSRLLMNSILLYYQYPPTIINEQKKALYYAALQQISIHQNSVPFYELVVQQELDSLQTYLSRLESCLPPIEANENQRKPFSESRS